MQNLNFFLIESFRFFAANGKKQVQEKHVVEFVSHQFKNLTRKANVAYRADEDVKRIIVGSLHGSKHFRKNADSSWTMLEDKA